MVDLNYLKEIKEKYKNSLEKAKNIGYINKDFEKINLSNDNKIAEIRGNILNKMIGLEHSLCVFLSMYFSEKKSKEFYEHILSKDFFTMAQKIKLFNKIKYHEKPEFKDSYKDLGKILMKLSEWRNFIAHGTKFSIIHPKVGYPHSNKVVVLDNEFIKKFSQYFDIAIFCILDLQDKIRKERKG